MYGVSDAFKARAKGIVQRMRLTGSVGAQAFTDANVIRGTFIVTNQCSGEIALDIGQVYVGELDATFRGVDIDRYSWRGKTIRAFVGLMMEGGQYESVPLGVFTIKEASWTGDGMKVVAYDGMTNFDRACSTSSLQKATAYALASTACGVCGVSLGTTETEFRSFANGAETLSIYDENDVETWRDLLAWIAQTTATFATIGRDGRLYFREYTQDAIDTLAPQQRHMGGSFADYATRYTGISVVDENAQMTRYYGMATDDALTYNLGSNPFLQFKEDADRERCCRAILAKMQKISYVPFSIGVSCGVHYDLGDVIEFTDGLAGERSLCCVTKFTFNFSAADRLSGSGEDPALASGNSKSDKNLSGILSKVEYQNSLIRSTERRYYDYVNEDDTFTVTDGGGMVKFADIDYEAGARARIEFRAEVKMTVSTTETEVDGTYTENDAVVKVSYRDIGEWVTEYYPVDTFLDGARLLHLLYFWTSPGFDGDTRNFQAWMECSGASLSIAAGDVHAYVTTSGELSEDVYLMYIMVAEQPDTTIFYVGDTLDYTGLVVAAYYSDGSVVDVTGDCTFRPAEYSEAAEAGLLTVDAGYEEDGENYHAPFYLTVLESKSITSIAIVTYPSKLTYDKGELFDWTGLTVAATYADGTTEDITALCTVTPASGAVATAIGSNLVQVSYADVYSGSVFQAEFTATVIEIARVYVAQPPDRTVYRSGETYDWTGLVLMASYSDGSERDVTAIATCAPADGDTVQYIKRDWDDDPHSLTCVPGIIDPYNPGQYFYDQFIVQIYNTYVTELQVVQMPTKTEYSVGELLDYTGIQVNAVWADGHAEDVTASCTFSPAAGSEAVWDMFGNAAITVRYEGEAQKEETAEYTAGFRVAISGHGTFDLRYVNYSIDEEGRVIRISSLNVANILEDGLATLEIPDTHVIDGVAYQIYIA